MPIFRKNVSLEFIPKQEQLYPARSLEGGISNKNIGSKVTKILVARSR